MKESWKQLQDWIKEAKQMVFFGGAGVSTESGIPDFRGEAGIYQTISEFGVRPEEILSHSFFLRDPETFYAYYKKYMLFPDAKPNAAHLALARLEQEGKLTAVITQNIDGLHQKAGSQRVYELHGSVRKNHCLRCGKQYPLAYIQKAEGVPRCSCGGMVRPDIVLYEEGLDEKVLYGAVAQLQKADLLLVGGTSLNVYPAAGLLQYFGGKHLVLINRDETPMDGQADLVLHDKIGEVLGAVVGV